MKLLDIHSTDIHLSPLMMAGTRDTIVNILEKDSSA